MISVIVPVYNVEKYLDKCIESIVNQTYKDLEIILIDDGSPDNCPQMCDEWAKKDNRIKVIHKTNNGVSAARNSGLKIASGEFIGFVDSDDYIADNMYETLLNHLNLNDADISVCSSFLVSENEEIKADSKMENVVCNQKEALEKISYTMNNSLWNKLFKKELLADCKFDEGHTFGEDHLFLLNVFAKVRKVAFISDPLYYYLQRSNSTTGSKFCKRSFDQIYMKDALYEFVRENYSYLSDYYFKLCFTARENICRKIILSNSETEFKSELNEYFIFMKSNYDKIKTKLNKKEKLEYKLMIFSKSIYKIIFRKLLRR